MAATTLFNTKEQMIVYKQMLKGINFWSILIIQKSMHVFVVCTHLSEKKNN